MYGSLLKSCLLYRTKVGMVFQQFNLFNNMSVVENCMVGQVKVLNIDKEKRARRLCRIWNTLAWQVT
jgi:ABC-type polar amino acid transport system ATPase subunit